jgi:predicted HTH domain antitoxin
LAWSIQKELITLDRAAEVLKVSPKAMNDLAAAWV